MGAVRKDSPKPWAQRRATTTFLRVPRVDWAAVKIGVKREFRMPGGRAMSQLWSVTPPTPVVAYTELGNDRYDSRLMVLEGHWRELLQGMSADSLAREGFASYAEFRRYWMGRTKRRYHPLAEVSVYLVRPWMSEDREAMAAALLERLYGEHLRQDESRTIATTAC